MYIVIPTLVLAVLAGIVAAWKEKNQQYKVAQGFLGFVCGIAVGCSFFLLGSWGIWSRFIPKEVDVRKVSIVSFRDSTTLQGAFLLGSGVLQSQATYSFYEQHNDGGIVRKIFPADAVTVYQDAPENIGWYIEKGFFYDCESLGFRQYLTFCDSTIKSHNIFEFHIPPDSLVNDFNLSQ
ncbi:MAG TPA: hypothetical protein VLI92_03760 [Candidatus Saccharimonadales bacterium]|nr:hypothetical protein [Candidatus Saccharimonadales bacterium]